MEKWGMDSNYSVPSGGGGGRRGEGRERGGRAVLYTRVYSFEYRSKWLTPKTKMHLTRPADIHALLIAHGLKVYTYCTHDIGINDPFTDAFINETLSVLSASSKNDKPFYMFLSFTTPHAGAIGSVNRGRAGVANRGICAYTYRMQRLVSLGLINYHSTTHKTGQR